MSKSFLLFPRDFLKDMHLNLFLLKDKDKINIAISF